MRLAVVLAGERVNAAIQLQQVIALVLISCVLVWLNLKAGKTWLKQVTLWPMLACLGVAVWIVLRWVFA